MRVKLTRADRIRVLNSDDVYTVMRRVLLRENKIDRDKEHFWVVCLSNVNKILLVELISLGTIKQSVIDPTEVFSLALQKRSSQLIMVHNHPGGSLKPSEPDIDITDRMYQVGQIVDLPVIDHLIITEYKFYSFLDSGLLAEIAKSKKYVARYKLEEERLKNLGRQEGIKIGLIEGRAEGEQIGIKIGEERGLEKGRVEGEKIGIEKGRIEMAKGMKQVGIDIKIIAELSRLTEEQIEKL